MATRLEDLEWDRLILHLNTWTSAVAVGRERIRVVLASEGVGPREVEIVMSPDDWSDIWGTAYGDFNQAVADVRRALEDLPSEPGFLVYNCYELHPSTAANLPENPEAARFREILLQHPDGTQGASWVAYTDDGVAHPLPELPASERFVRSLLPQVVRFTGTRPVGRGMVAA